MNCEHCLTRVDEYVDGTLPAAERADVEQHLAACAACAALARDFRAIRAAAGGLDRHAPPAYAWTKLAAALEIERERRLSYVGRIFRSGSAWQPLATAALLLLLVGGMSWFVLQQFSASRPTTQQAVAPAAADPDLVQSVETELKLAEEHYQKAIAGLEQITRTGSAALDPQVAAVLQKNLEVIDQAIGESRQALQTQPTSEVAQESLFEALRNKVSLLQNTVGLINEMRKGNQEGAARIVSGLNQ
jgi:anti-sigma factor RsiW